MTTRWTGFQSPLAGGIETFLAYKRALGCRFRGEEMNLRLFDRFLVEHHIATLEDISPVVIDAFLASRPRADPRSYNHLRGTVARCFEWLAARSLVSQCPVRAKPRRTTRTRLPFLFDSQTARRLIEAATNLPDNSFAPLRGPTYRVIFALLYALGLRVGEVARLQLGDIDLTRQLLVVRNTKFAKSRLVPFGPRIGSLVKEFLDLRAAHGSPLVVTTPVFSFGHGRPISAHTISRVFHELVPRLGLCVPEGTSAPCAHTLRHSFAVGTLLRWYRSGIDPGSRLLQLSTFLGHVNPASTALYLTITTELLAEANQRFERWANPVIQGVLL
jgi:site-specific recombinase XerD